MHGEKNTCCNTDISGKCPAVSSGINTVYASSKATASTESAIYTHIHICVCVSNGDISHKPTHSGSACYNYVMLSVLFRRYDLE